MLSPARSIVGGTWQTNKDFYQREVTVHFESEFDPLRINPICFELKSIKCENSFVFL